MVNTHEETALEFLGEQYQKCWKFVKGFDSGLVVGALSVVLIILTILVPLVIVGFISWGIHFWLGWAIWASSLSAVGIIVVLILLYAFGYHIKNR